MNLLRVLAVLCCVALAAAWEPPAQNIMVNICGRDAIGDFTHVGNGGDSSRRVATFNIREETASPYTVPGPRIEIERIDYEYANAIRAVPRDLEITCKTFCRNGDLSPPWTCAINYFRTDENIELIDWVMICEDVGGTPFVHTYVVPVVHKSCFLKVVLLDHTPPPIKKVPNAMRHTTIHDDRGPYEFIGCGSSG